MLTNQRTEKRVLRNALLLTTLALTTLSATAKTIRVAKTGTPDFVKIQDAVDAASSGDRLRIESGVYVENISLGDKALELFAPDGPNSTIVKPEFDGTAVIRVIASSSTEISIRGLTIDGVDGANRSSVGIHSSGARLRVEDCTILNNGDSLSDGGGIYLDWPGRTTIDDVFFYQNMARNGGGLYIINGPFGPEGLVTVKNSTFEKNTGSGYGGGMSTQYTEALIDNCDFTDNSSTEGGGLYVGPHPQRDVTVNKTTFRDNVSFGDGGGVLIESIILYDEDWDDWDFMWEEWTIIMPLGGINRYVLLASPNFIDCLSQDNEAASNGGGYAARHLASFDMENCRTQRNNASLGGGGISLCESTGTVTSSKIVKNTADSVGGGVYASNSSELDMADSKVQKNNAVDGGGLYAEFLSTLIIENTKVVKNIASRDGGGLALSASEVRFDGGQAKKNSAADQGGGIYALTSSVSFRDAKIDKNIANDGGGFCFDQSSGRIMNCKVKGNAKFGARFKSSLVKVKDSTLCDNASNDVKGAFNDQGGNKICKL